MPKNLVRYQKGGVFHFLTLSCYRRLALLDSSAAYRTFECELEKVRRRYRFVVAGYVLMPEHVHLLVGEPKVSIVSMALKVLKQETSKKLKRPGMAQFWQRRYYDFNVWTDKKRVEKLRQVARSSSPQGVALNHECLCPVHRVLCDERAGRSPGNLRGSGLSPKIVNPLPAQTTHYPLYPQPNYFARFCR